MDIPSRSQAPKIAAAVLAGLAAGGAVWGAAWKLQVQPARAEAALQDRAHAALMRLFDLQTAYYEAHETYAVGLDAILMSAPDAQKLRSELKAVVDLETLVIVGDDERFRIEANVLDSRRSLVKFRGPR